MFPAHADLNNGYDACGQQLYNPHSNKPGKDTRLSNCSIKVVFKVNQLCFNQQDQPGEFRHALLCGDLTGKDYNPQVITERFSITSTAVLLAKIL